MEPSDCPYRLLDFYQSREVQVQVQVQVPSYECKIQYNSYVPEPGLCTVFIRTGGPSVHDGRNLESALV
jgi:hypothetical protein